MVTPAQPSRRFLGQGDKLGKYEVIRQIAVGGMAELYLARTVGMEGFEKLVCVKRILPQYVSNPSFVNMFLNEARLAATLHHPNIAQVYDIGQEQGEFFFAMEYVHGEDLGRLVATAHENGVPISLDCALTVVSGLCAGLHHAHEKASQEGKPLGVVHRDVSPTNVLVSYDGAVKLVDFGIARAGGEPATSTTGLKGKVTYMSPEQCRGNVALDRRSDVFSVGTILYELTVGRRPFTDETEYGVMQQIVTCDVERPSLSVAGYPPALEAIVLRALSRDVDRRFSTALELQNQLEDYAHDNRLRVSPLVLARLMSTLFPARLEEWDHARAQGAFFVEQHVVRTLIESGKTPDASQRLPEPLPSAADDVSGASEVSGTGVPAGPGSAPDMATQVGPPPEATQVGPPPMATHVGPPPVAPGRMATPPVASPAVVGPSMASQPGAAMGSPAMSSPGSRASQPRLPTPPPVPGVQPLPGVRYAQMPVPNMPGAVPILTPMMAPPIATAGTLVSSALQAGTMPGASRSTPVPSMPVAAPLPGMPVTTLPGTPVPVMAGMSPAMATYGVPAAAADFGPGDPARGAPHFVGVGRDPHGRVDPARISDGYPAQTLQDGGEAAPMASRAANARPTLVMRTRRRSWLPIAAVAGAGIIGAVAVMVVLASDGEAPAGRSAEPAAVPASDQRPSEPTATKVEAPESADPARTAPAAAAPRPGTSATSETPAAPASPAVKADEPGSSRAGKVESAAAAAGHETAAAMSRAPGAPGAPGATGSTRGSAPGAAPAKLVESASASSAATDQDSGRKRSVKAVPDPRKPGRSRTRADSRRADPKRAARPEAKEQTWNEDSPFLPVPSTPKR